MDGFRFWVIDTKPSWPEHGARASWKRAWTWQYQFWEQLELNIRNVRCFIVNYRTICCESHFYSREFVYRANWASSNGTEICWYLCAIDPSVWDHRSLFPEYTRPRPLKDGQSSGGYWIIPNYRLKCLPQNPCPPPRLHLAALPVQVLMLAIHPLQHKQLLQKYACTLMQAPHKTFGSDSGPAIFSEVPGLYLPFRMPHSRQYRWEE